MFLPLRYGTDDISPPKMSHLFSANNLREQGGVYCFAFDLNIHEKFIIATIFELHKMTM